MTHNSSATHAAADLSMDELDRASGGGIMRIIAIFAPVHVGDTDPDLGGTTEKHDQIWTVTTS